MAPAHALPWPLIPVFVSRSNATEYDYNWTTWGTCKCERFEISNPYYFDFACCAPGKDFDACPVRYGWQSVGKRDVVFHAIGSVITASMGIVASIAVVTIVQRHLKEREARRAAEKKLPPKSKVETIELEYVFADLITLF